MIFFPPSLVPVIQLAGSRALQKKHFYSLLCMIEHSIPSRVELSVHATV